MTNLTQDPQAGQLSKGNKIHWTKLIELKHGITQGYRRELKVTSLAQHKGHLQLFKYVPSVGMDMDKDTSIKRKKYI